MRSEPASPPTPAAVLRSLGLTEADLAAYGIRVAAACPGGSDWAFALGELDGQAGAYAIRIFTRGEARARGAADLWRRLEASGVVPLLVRTLEGRPFTALADGRILFVSAWPGGSPPDLSDAAQAAQAARALASFHAAARGWSPPEGAALRKTPDLAGQMEEGIFLLRMARLAAAHRIRQTGFDRRFLGVAGYFLEQAGRARARLEAPWYQDLAARARRDRAVSAGRCRPARMRTDGQRIVWVECLSARYGLPPADVANLLERTLAATEWQADTASAVLGAYEAAGGDALGDPERGLIAALLEYPRDLVGLVADYYLKPDAHPESDCHLRLDQILDRENLRARWLADWTEADRP